MGGESEKLILVRLDRLEQKVDRVQATLTEHRVQHEGRMARVEVKSSVFGTIGGAVAAALLKVFT